MSMIAVESQIAIFLRKYTPAVEEQLREARTRLRAMFPRGFELVYDNYNALVFGISPTERTSDAFISGTQRHQYTGGRSAHCTSGASL